MKRVGILVYDGVSALELASPLEAFARAGENGAAFEILLVAEDLGAVVAAGGLRLAPQRTLTTLSHCDVLVVPGGPGAESLLEHRVLLNWLARAGRNAEALLVTGSGALLAGAAGLLDGRRATTHWTELPRLREISPAATLAEGAELVEDGALVSATGAAAGLSASVGLVERLVTRDAARRLARTLDLSWPPEGAEDDEEAAP